MPSDKRTSADPEFQAWFRKREEELSDSAGPRSGSIAIRLIRDRSKEPFGVALSPPDHDEATQGRARLVLTIDRQWLAVEHEVQYLSDVPWSPAHNAEHSKTLLEAEAEEAGEDISRVFFKATLEEKQRCISFVDGALAETERLIRDRLPGFLRKAFEDAIHHQRKFEEAQAGPIHWRRLKRKNKRGGQPGDPLTYYRMARARSIVSGLSLNQIFHESTRPKRLAGRYDAGAKIWSFLMGRRDPTTE